ELPLLWFGHLKYNASVLAFSIFIRKKRRMAVNYCNSALSSFREQVKKWFESKDSGLLDD
ncbi:hypothetical protein, partial [Limosilactobacillus reuteri]|uniref:hypothetical protein n=1 Tax=Limosilactobacillus reuteri TaxID=1598 RepID=UPI001CDD570F